MFICGCSCGIFSKFHFMSSIEKPLFFLNFFCFISFFFSWVSTKRSFCHFPFFKAFTSALFLGNNTLLFVPSCVLFAHFVSKISVYIYVCVLIYCFGAAKFRSIYVCVLIYLYKIYMHA